MAQASDNTVDNGTGAAVRSDINTRLAALFTNHSGTTDTTMVEKYAHQFWADNSSTQQLKIRNGTNTGWISLRTLDGGVIASEGTVSSPAITFGTASDTGFYRPASTIDNQVNLAIDGTPIMSVGYNVNPGGTPNRGVRIGPGASVTSGYVKPSLQTSASEDSRGIYLSETGFLQVSGKMSPPCILNRLGNDGNMLQFKQESVIEGVVEVNGTTVSYIGGHLSRWSQLPGGNSRSEILRGTVMSNTDEMCEWGEEDNEQLNRCKISEIEGDVDVSGVFQSWDDDDDEYTNDFVLAVTGDFVIRIAQDTTIARGDLLMSAGDGTAKPQGDDIVRSKTVAKVTSTEVSATHPDGSYCVPCVLMAC